MSERKLNSKLKFDPNKIYDSEKLDFKLIDELPLWPRCSDDIEKERLFFEKYFKSKPNNKKELRFKEPIRKQTNNKDEH